MCSPLFRAISSAAPFFSTIQVQKGFEAVIIVYVQIWCDLSGVQQMLCYAHTNYYHCINAILTTKSLLAFLMYFGINNCITSDHLLLTISKKTVLQ